MKLVLASLGLLLVLGAAGAAVAIKVHHDDEVQARHRAEAAARARAAAARRAAEQHAQAARAAEAAKREAEVHEREVLENGLEAAITKEAEHDVQEGLLTGPIKSTTCTPVSGGSSQELAGSTGIYSCLAVNSTSSEGTESGYHFSGTINFKTGSYTWRLGGGE